MLAKHVPMRLESVSQTAKQIKQYQTQFRQYENQLKNTIAPAVYIWDQAQTLIQEVTQVTDTISYYQNLLGSLDAYLENFRDLNYYRSSPCFSPTGCSKAGQAAPDKNLRLASESQKKANDAVLRGINLQQRNLKSDARKLKRLQDAAQSAEGQLEAIGYANQLLQIRNVLISQQNAIANRLQYEVDKEARQEAASKQFRRGGYVPSPHRSW